MSKTIDSTDTTLIAQQAEAAWQRGLHSQHAGRLEEAHGHFRRAHDLVLLGLAPLAIFEIVAYVMKRQVLGGAICARGPRGGNAAHWP